MSKATRFGIQILDHEPGFNLIQQFNTAIIDKVLICAGLDNQFGIWFVQVT